MTEDQDSVKWLPRIKVDQYSPEQVRELTAQLGYEPKAADFARLAVTPERTVEAEGNILTTAGLGALTNLLTGAAANAMSTTQTGIGVGATNTAETRADVQLAGNGNSTTAWYQLVDAAPGVTRVTTTLTNDSVQAVATFASGNANFAWNEWCFVTGSGAFTSGNAITALSAGTEVMLNRKVTSMGTKVSGAVWVFTGTIQFA